MSTKKPPCHIEAPRPWPRPEPKPKVDISKLTGVNVGKPIMKVKHTKMERVRDSAFKSKCPQCKEGILGVRRDPETFALQEKDFCMLCGQAFLYTDFKKAFKNLA